MPQHAEEVNDFGDPVANRFHRSKRDHVIAAGMILSKNMRTVFTRFLFMKNWEETSFGCGETGLQQDPSS